MTSEEVRSLADRVLSQLGKRPALRFAVKKGKPGLFDCKLGGVPYFPKSMEYPKGEEGDYEGEALRLLAQINFEKIPHIPDFPEKGILQFFCACDENYLYGWCTSGNEYHKQNGFRIIYHEDITTDETKLMTAEEMPDFGRYDDPLSVGEFFPFAGEYILEAGEPEQISANSWDYRFSELFLKYYNEIAETPADSLYKMSDDVWHSGVWKELNGGEDGSAFIGGYPQFTQEDPRGHLDYRDCDTVLFELMSIYDRENDIEIAWGDMGTGTFLIPRERLVNKDFSRVVYNYDCC